MSRWAIDRYGPAGCERIAKGTQPAMEAVLRLYETRRVDDNEASGAKQYMEGNTLLTIYPEGDGWPAYYEPWKRYSSMEPPKGCSICGGDHYTRGCNYLPDEKPQW